MKSTSLITKMLQLVLSVPAVPHSVFPVIIRLYLDMGYDQSIENDLSTFSSRLIWMKHTLQQELRDALVLIDEAGSGTDPVEGADPFRPLLKSGQGGGHVGS